MEFLIFQVYAPLVSWGDMAVGEVRRSHRQPTKSQVVGMVAAGLGIQRTEEDRLNELAHALSIGIKLYSAGSNLQDYHTTQVPPSSKKKTYFSRREELSAEVLNTILSYREYRCDAYSQIALYTSPSTLDITLNQIQQGLQEPAFHIYFGRKSCPPALPLAPKIVQAESLKHAFDQYQPKPRFPMPFGKKPEWLEELWNKNYTNYPEKYEKSISYFWEPGTGIETGLSEEGAVEFERYDQPLSKTRWQFLPRRERMVSEEIKASKEQSNINSESNDYLSEQEVF